MNMMGGKGQRDLFPKKEEEQIPLPTSSPPLGEKVVSEKKTIRNNPLAVGCHVLSYAAR
jgi:hypothetical protein